MSRDSLQIGLMHSTSALNSLGQAVGQFANESPFLVLALGFPKEEGDLPDIKRKLLQRTNHFPQAKSIRAPWKLLPSVRIYSRFCCKLFSAS
jgi:hypothetical protein